MTYSTTRCIATYHSITVNQDGTLDPCCQYTARENKSYPVPIHFTKFSEYHKTLQTSMHNDAENNVKHAGCSKCWDEESAGWKTLRDYHDIWYKNIATNKLDEDNPIYHVELRLGNYCNLKCIMCQPRASSSIQIERNTHEVEFRKIGIHVDSTKIPHYWETPEFMEFSERILKDVKRINITGGEPFIIPEVTVLLDKMMPVKDTIHISFNTNLTKVSNKLISKLREFKHLTICVSLEGIGAMNDYVRYPSKWNELEKNLEKIKIELPQACISANHTLQHTSVYAFPELAQFCYDQNMGLEITFVQGIDRLKFESAPPEDLQKFLSWVKTATVLTPTMKTTLINKLSSVEFNKELHTQYVDYITLLDKIRGTNYNELFNPTGY